MASLSEMLLSLTALLDVAWSETQIWPDARLLQTVRGPLADLQMMERLLALGNQRCDDRAHQHVDCICTVDHEVQVFGWQHSRELCCESANGVGGTLRLSRRPRTLGLSSPVQPVSALGSHPRQYLEARKCSITSRASLARPHHTNCLPWCPIWDRSAGCC